MELSEEMRIFLVEAHESLDRVEELLVDLERSPSNSEDIAVVFRLIHTMKGNSGFLGLKKLEVLCHRAETVLDRARSGTLHVDSDVVSILLSAIDAMRALCRHLESTGTEDGIDTSIQVAELNEMIVA
jgi:two-component system chemotaxis sensor kinase CheA